MRLLLTAICLLISACVSTPTAFIDALMPADAILLGEQHDAEQHQVAHHGAVQSLASRGALAALALEMAEQGASTAGLPREADEAAVRSALRWNDEAWPWKAYGPAVMAAVKAGVPVFGANLPRAQMRAAMGDERLDTLLKAEAFEQQRKTMAQGHCGLLPESQLLPMARIQVARDRAMARTVADAAKPGQTVLLVAGAGHVDPALGVPQHLPSTLKSHSLEWPKQPPKKDYCAELRQRMAPVKPQ